MTESEPRLLVLDYPGRRTEARVRELGLEQYGFDVRYLLTPPFPRAVTAASYAEELLAQHGPFGSVAGVLSYCMAAPIAQHVTAALSVARSPIPMVAFDGEPATAAALQDQYGVTIGQLADELGVARPEIAAIDAAVLASAPETVVATMKAALVELATAALTEDDDEDGDDDGSLAETAEGLAGFYLDWLVHLVAAGNATWPEWRGRVLHVVSRDHGFTRDWPGAASTELVHVDVARPDLLAQATVGPLVASFLGGEPEDAQAPDRSSTARPATQPST